jgi:hypothetical protein
MPNAEAQRTTAQDVLRAVQSNHIWLNAMQCYNPTAEFCEQLGRDILAMLQQRDNLLPKFNPNIEQETPSVQEALDGMSKLTPMLYLSINKS